MNYAPKPASTWLSYTKRYCGTLRSNHGDFSPDHLYLNLGMYTRPLGKKPSQPELLHYSWKDAGFKKGRFRSSVAGPLSIFKM